MTTPRQARGNLPAGSALARSGDPGWRAFDDAYLVMIFDAAGGGVQADPRGDEPMICRRGGGSARRALVLRGWVLRG